MITPEILVRLGAWICFGAPSNTMRMGSRPPTSSLTAGFVVSVDRIPSAPFGFNQANADGWSPADEGSWPRNSGDQTSGEPPSRVAIARSATPRSEAATMYPRSYVQVIPIGTPPGLIVLHDRPPTLSCESTRRLPWSSGPSSALNVSTSL